jgi:rRNA maturation RNase YbeY
MQRTLSVSNKTRGMLPRIPFVRIKDTVLGKRFELSLALLTPSEMRRVTLERKGKDKASNVLSFRLSNTSGEVLLCPATARTEASKFGMTYSTFLGYLFIHGLFHIKGLPHGGTMEREERRIMKRFGLRAHE